MCSGKGRYGRKDREVMSEKSVIIAYKEIICSKCQEHYEVRLEPVYNDDGFVGYLKDNFINHVCPNCGNVDKG